MTQRTQTDVQFGKPILERVSVISASLFSHRNRRYVLPAWQNLGSVPKQLLDVYVARHVTS